MKTGLEVLRQYESYLGHILTEQPLTNHLSIYLTLKQYNTCFAGNQYDGH